jgi:hypothetical protein
MERVLLEARADAQMMRELAPIRQQVIEAP